MEVTNDKGAAMLDVSSKIISERKNQQTGTVIQLLDNRDLGADIQLSVGRWEAVCVDHGFVMGFATKATAIAGAADPVDWCERCGGGDWPSLEPGRRALEKGTTAFGEWLNQ